MAQLGDDARNRPPIAPDATQIEDLRALDAVGLKRYAEEGVDVSVWNPVRMLARVAFGVDPPYSIEQAAPLVEAVGIQINEPTICVGRGAIDHVESHSRSDNS